MIYQFFYTFTVCHANKCIRVVKVVIFFYVILKICDVWISFFCVLCFFLISWGEGGGALRREGGYLRGWDDDARENAGTERWMNERLSLPFSTLIRQKTFLFLALRGFVPLIIISKTIIYYYKSNEQYLKRAKYQYVLPKLLLN